MLTKFSLICLYALLVLAQAPPGTNDLNGAYSALAAKDYDTAIELFRKALVQQPGNAAAHKDLAYTLLKAGENADARDEFAAAAKLNPKDDVASLEYAFLAYETGQPISARRTFDRIRHSANPATRATAEQAFQNIDRPWPAVLLAGRRPSLARLAPTICPCTRRIGNWLNWLNSATICRSPLPSTKSAAS